MLKDDTPGGRIVNRSRVYARREQVSTRRTDKREPCSFDFGCSVSSLSSQRSARDRHPEQTR